MEEALYVVQFGNALGDYINHGIVVFETGRFYGGDSGYYYVGDLHLDRGKGQGAGKIVRHNPLVISAFGDDAAEFSIEFEIFDREDGTISGTMSRLDMPGVPIPVLLTLKESLPNSSN